MRGMPSSGPNAPPANSRYDQSSPRAAATQFEPEDDLMKFTAFALSLALSFLMGASASAQTKKAYTFGLVAKSQSNPVFQAARTGAEQAAKDLSAKNGLTIKIDWRTPNDEDPQKQAE